jgi:hypothetical protein
MVLQERRKKGKSIALSYECSRERQRREAGITKLMVAFAVAAMRPRRCRRRMCIYVTNLYKYVL